VALGTRPNNTSHGAVRGRRTTAFYFYKIPATSDRLNVVIRGRAKRRQKQNRMILILRTIKVKNKRFLISLDE